MKYKFYALIVVLFAATNSCTKDDDTSEGGKSPIPLELTGKWNYTEYYMSIGSPGSWYPAEVPGKWINFKSDGSFSSNLAPFDKATGYHLTDNMHIQFTTAVRSDSSLYYFFSIDTLKRSISLSPGRFICIEGCAQKFVK